MTGSTPGPYLISDKTSFAHESAIKRWPVILTQVIDAVFRVTRDSTDAEHTAEGKGIVEKLAKLKYELQHNRVLSLLDDDGGADIATYNAALASLGPDPKWFSTPWLYTECYLYRRLRTFFSLTKTWTTYDPFSPLKSSTLKSSLPAVSELAARYLDLITHPLHLSPTDPENNEKLYLLFTEILEISLWGNATDLSLLTSLTYTDLQALQSSSARKESEKNILANDIPRVFHALTAAKPGQVDIVLDNSGFELYVDLVLAGWLLETKLATEVVLHPKNIPWFVSDVLPHDFAELLNALHNSVSFFGTHPHTEELEKVFRHWASLHADGRLRISTNDFWTSYRDFRNLPEDAPDVWDLFKESELVVYKGDLNYRKLTGDLMWEPETPFQEAIGRLGERGNGVRTLALRTCKADVVVGLKEGADEELRMGERERRWAWGGRYAVVQFWDGKEGVEVDM